MRAHSKQRTFLLYLHFSIVTQSSDSDLSFGRGNSVCAHEISRIENVKYNTTVYNRWLESIFKLTCFSTYEEKGQRYESSVICYVIGKFDKRKQHVWKIVFCLLKEHTHDLLATTTHQRKGNFPSERITTRLHHKFKLLLNTTKHHVRQICDTISL